MAVEDYLAAVRCGDTVDDADECGLACTVRSEQSKYFSALHADRYVVERGVLGVSLRDVSCYKHFVGFHFTDPLVEHGVDHCRGDVISAASGEVVSDYGGCSP